MRIRSPENAHLWKVADDALEPVLDDYGTAAALLRVLVEVMGDRLVELRHNKKGWIVRIPAYHIYEEQDTLGEALAVTLLILWDEKKLNVPKVF